MEELEFLQSYLKSKLNLVTTKVNKEEIQLGKKVLGLIDEDECVLYPREIQPAKLRQFLPEFYSNGAMIAVAASRDDDKDDSEERLATLAKVIASGTKSMVLLEGIIRILFKQTDSHFGVITKIIIDAPDPQPNLVFIAYDAMKRIQALEDTEDSFITANRTLALCENLRVKFFKIESAFERRVLINQIMNASDQSIICRRCYEAYQVITILTKHSRSFIGVESCINPNGKVFRVLRYPFADLENMGEYGTPVADFSWYKGYKWSFATCGNCGHILGWRFVPSQLFFTQANSFWGICASHILNSSEVTKLFPREEQ